MASGLKARNPTTRRAPQLIAIGDQTGGVNLRVSPTLVAQDQTRACRDWSLEEPGALIVREGYTQYSSQTFGSGRAQGGARTYLSSHTFTLVAAGQVLYKVDESGAGAVVSSGLSTREIHFNHDRDQVVYWDGVNRPMRSTDGSTWTPLGITAAIAGPSVSTLSSGVASSGEYSFAYSYKDRAAGYESNISSGSTITLSGSTGAFHLTATASTETVVDAYVWYGKDLSAGETIFRKISSGAASTYRVTDTNWTANAEAPLNHDVLAKGLFGAVWKNRWWVVDPDVKNRIRFSELFLGQAFPALYYIDIPFERGDAITAVSPLGDVLIVWGQSRAYHIIGQTSLDFEVRPSAGAVTGCLGPRAWAQVEQGIVHAAPLGVLIYDGATDRLLSYPIEPAWRDYTGNAGSEDVRRTPVVYEGRRKCIRVGVTRAYPSGQPGEWELNLDRSRGSAEAWCQTGRSVGGYIAFDGAEAVTDRSGELVTWHSSVGLLFKESTGTTANSSNMVAEMEGPTLAFGMHRARMLEVHGEYEPNAGTFSIEPVVDSVSQGTYAVPISGGLSLYDTALYDTGTYDGLGRRKWYQILPLAAEGRTFTLKQTYTGQARFRSFGYAVVAMPESDPRTFTE